MERKESYIVDVVRRGPGTPMSGGIRDSKGRLVSQYTNPRRYREPISPTKVVVDNSEYVKNELKAQALGYGVGLVCDGIRYVASRPIVRNTVDQGIDALVGTIGDFFFGRREKKNVQEPRRQDMQYQDKKTQYSECQGYGTWREIELCKPQALPKKLNYQGMRIIPQQMGIVSAGEIEKIKRSGK